MRETTFQCTLDIHGADALERYQALSARISGRSGVLEVSEVIVDSRAEFSLIRMSVRIRFENLEAGQELHREIMHLVTQEPDLSLVGASPPPSDLDD